MQIEFIALVSQWGRGPRGVCAIFAGCAAFSLALGCASGARLANAVSWTLTVLAGNLWLVLQHPHTHTHTHGGRQQHSIDRWRHSRGKQRQRVEIFMEFLFGYIFVAYTLMWFYLRAPHSHAPRATPTCTLTSWLAGSLSQQLTSLLFMTCPLIHFN